MKKNLFSASATFLMIFLSILFANTSVQAADIAPKKEILPEYKEEITALYQECMQQKHGIMLKCIQKKANQLNEDVNIFDDELKTTLPDEWQAPKEYKERVNPFPPTEENIKKGEQIFQFYCATCHGSDARGQNPNANYNRPVADLTNAYLQQRTDGEIFWKINEGGWPMPAFWEGDELKENDLWFLINYLRSLSSQKN